MHTRIPGNSFCGTELVFKRENTQIWKSCVWSMFRKRMCVWKRNKLRSSVQSSKSGRVNYALKTVCQLFSFTKSALWKKCVCATFPSVSVRYTREVVEGSRTFQFGVFLSAPTKRRRLSEDEKSSCTNEACVTIDPDLFKCKVAMGISWNVYHATEIFMPQVSPNRRK